MGNAYLEKVLNDVSKKNSNEPEFVQAVDEVLSTLEKVIDKHPEYQKIAMLERVVEPERLVSFRMIKVKYKLIEATEYSLTGF